MLLQIDTKRIEPDITILAVSGKIALGRESHKLETAVQDLLRQDHKKIILDLSAVDHMDSTGIGIIAYCFGTLNLHRPGWPEPRARRNQVGTPKTSEIASRIHGLAEAPPARA